MASKALALVGRKITAVRPMTAKELEREGWTANRRHGLPTALVLDDGTVLYPSQDEEGNGPGVMYGWDGQTLDCFIVRAP